jgi:hypothetical protein
MKSFTDERVRKESAPFDHPELFIPEGEPEVLRRIPARDALGNAAPQLAITIDPFPNPTNQATPTISGTKEAGATIRTQVNNGPAVPADSPSAITWSATLSGLVEGNNSITITSTDAAGIITTETLAMALDTTPPALALNAVSTPTRSDDHVLSGTVEAGVTPVVKVSTAAAIVGPVTITGTTWSASVSLLASGPNDITVTATDPAGNLATQAASILVFGDGIFNGTRIPDISDAIKALRIAVGLIQPAAADLHHGDVAPLGAPDGRIDIADVVLILRNLVGSITLVN